MSRKKLNLILFVAITTIFLANSGQHPISGTGGYTSAPGDGVCSSCHSGGSFDGDVTISGLPVSIMANNTYTLTLTSNVTTGTPNRAGFQMLALNSLNLNAGSLSNNMGNSSIKMVNGKSYFGHFPATLYGGNTSLSWTVDWTAPNDPNGDQITMYAVNVMGNGSGQTGDKVLFSNTFGTLTGAVDSLVASATLISDASCAGSNDGSAMASATGGILPYSFMWSNGETNDLATMLPSGEQTVVVTDAAFMTSSASVIISEPDPIVVSLTDQGDESCFGFSDGFLATETTGGDSNYSYLWSDVQITSTASGLTQDDYTLIVSDGTGCFGSNTFTVNGPDAPLSSSLLSTTDPLCNGSSDGIAELLVTGGTAPYFFLWDSGSDENPAINLNAGDHTVIITDLNNCSTSKMVTLGEPDSITIQVDSIRNATCGGINDGYVELSLTGGVPPYSLLWSDDSTTLARDTLLPGTYEVTVSDNNGCLDSLELLIGADSLLIINTINLQHISCFGQNDGTIEISAEGGNDPYSYTWLDGSLDSLREDLTSGKIFVTVTDSIGCEIIDSFEIVEPDELAGDSISYIHVSCNGGSDGMAVVGAMGGVPGYDFVWPDNTVNDTVIGISAGSHIVTITDQNDCFTLFQVFITEPDSLKVDSLILDNVTCHGGQDGAAEIFSSGGTGVHSYAWPDGIIDASRSDLMAGNYQVTIEDENGCLDSVSVSIAEPNELVLNPDSVPESMLGANDGEASVAPEGGTSPYSYMWSTLESTDTIRNLSPSNYSVTVTDAHNCSMTVTVIVGSGDCALSVIYTTTSVSCNGLSDGSAVIEVSDGTEPYTFSWVTGSDSSSITAQSAGIFSVTIIDAVDCQIVIDDIIITEPGELNATWNVIFAPICATDQTGIIDAAVSGGTLPYSYFWSTGSNEDTIYNVSPGQYSISVVDAHDCRDTTNVFIGNGDFEKPVPSLNNLELYIDEDGNVPSIDINDIDNGSTDNCNIMGLSFTEPVYSCENLGENSLAVKVFDDNGNFAEATITVTVIDTFPPVILCPSDMVVLKCLGITYSDPMVTDNCNNFSVSMIDGINSGNDFPPGVTTIQFEARDISGNTSTCSFLIDVDVELEAETATTDPTCFGFQNGSVDFNVNGTNPPFMVVVDNVVDLSTLGANDYNYTISDDIGCLVTGGFSIGEPDLLFIANEVITHASTMTSNDGSIDIDVIGGTPPYSFSWMLDGSEINMDEDLENAAPGEYNVLIEDDQGCLYSSVDYTINFDTGINDPELKRLVDLMPNPAHERLIINTMRSHTIIEHLILFNTAGKKVIDLRPDSDHLMLDVVDLSAGIYILKLILGEHTLTSRIVIE